MYCKYTNDPKHKGTVMVNKRFRWQLKEKKNQMRNTRRLKKKINKSEEQTFLSIMHQIPQKTNCMFYVWHMLVDRYIVNTHNISHFSQFQFEIEICNIFDWEFDEQQNWLMIDLYRLLRFLFNMYGVIEVWFSLSLL